MSRYDQGFQNIRGPIWPTLPVMPAIHCNPSQVLVIAIAIAGVFSLRSASAEPSIPVVPGEYEMVNDLVDTKTTNCFKGDKLSAEVLRAQMNEQGGNEQCKIIDSRQQGDRLILDLACQYDATEKGTGTMEISVSGETVKVKSTFRLTIEGQERSMEMNSVGKRVGGC